MTRSAASRLALTDSAGKAWSIAKTAIRKETAFLLDTPLAP